MSAINTPYENILEDIKNNGTPRQDRTGTGTTSVFGRQIRYNLEEGFPLLTTKNVFFRGVAEELLWFLRGDSNTAALRDKGVNIWNEWEDARGNLGPIYGVQWRKLYRPTGQIVELDIPVDTHADYNPESEPEFRQIANMGYFDDEMDLEHTHDPIFRLWQLMVWNCYSEDFVGYALHGAKGVTVSPFWLDYDNFRSTIHLVPGFYEWTQDSTFELDAHYYGAKVFSPDTAVFLPSYEARNIASKDGSCVEVEGKLYESLAQWDEVYAAPAREAWEKGEDFHGIPADAFKVVNPAEGKVFRKKIVHDQISDLVENIKNDPQSRRLIVSAWNPAEIDAMALPACHSMFQVFIDNGKLSLHVYQRSADMFLGVPFNIASYALLAHMLAQQTGYGVGDLVWSGGDCHVYDNHREAVMEQLSREPRPYPTINLNKAKDIFSYTWEDIEIEDYDPHPAITAEVSV